MAQGEGGGGQQGDGEGGFNVGMVLRVVCLTTLVQVFIGKFAKTQQEEQQQKAVAAGLNVSAAYAAATFRNAFGTMEECELFVYLYYTGAARDTAPPAQLPLEVLQDRDLAAQRGLELLWRKRVWYEEKAAVESVNVSIGPLDLVALHRGELEATSVPTVHATLVRVAALEKAGSEEAPLNASISFGSLPLVAWLRELNMEAIGENLLGGGNSAADGEKKVANASAAGSRLPYLKKSIDIRPVYDQTVYNRQNLQQPPFRLLKTLPEEGVYQPFLYMSDFWLLEKDYLALNESVADQRLNVTLSYSVASLMAWTIQTQMNDQWTTKSEWGLADSQRDSFMLKRMVTDTNPYFLAFSCVFVLLHTVFNWLAFKNDIQFWRNNESMQGLSARSMMVSFVCQLITGLYLLDSQETSRLILFEIFLSLALSFWKLKKAVKIGVKSSFPFIDVAGQRGYEDDSETSKYDKEAIRYMSYFLGPLFVIYVIRSLIYDKHRSWYAFIISNAAGGVYTFGFIMMTPQLYINYKLKSVEHLPWRALTYKAMNTFVDDIFAFLIDMPVMHRLSCFRDDIIFLVYVYQRWAYRVDKTRPSIYGEAANGGDAAALPADDAQTSVGAEAASSADSAESAAAGSAETAGDGAEETLLGDEALSGDSASIRQRR
eukprot:TRINITY_DN19510_c0_g2_i1.p1 TRINITY_DN19510_c0_g2~~TRINITY_DN19510_c0_g2_i1.p1  ORF type:complete len:692 (+),score=179.07 TRINITY_DN19510_c0_g2_i1:104-2077(+)